MTSVSLFYPQHNDETTESMDNMQSIKIQADTCSGQGREPGEANINIS